MISTEERSVEKTAPVAFGGARLDEAPVCAFNRKARHGPLIMEMPADLSLEQVRGQQRCINDLLTLLAFPAIWAGLNPSQIISSFADGLLRILRLDIVYVRSSHEPGAHSECLRVPHGAASEWSVAHEQFTALGSESAKWPRQLTLGAGVSTLTIEPVRLGLDAERGVVVAGSQRKGFPLQTEKLLLNVAANQLLMALQEEALNKARTELANVARVSSLGVLTAAIAHEVNQPISGIITNASTCLRMLSAQPPNIAGALETARRTIRDGNRASDVISRLRTLYTKRDLQPELVDLNEAAREVASLLLSELQRNRVIMRHEFADDLPAVKGDRIQLQQVILNLLRNASDAMSTVTDRARELLIRTERQGEDRVVFSVKDAGIGLSAQAIHRIYDPFYTTKGDGMGIGLSVSRSIIEAHFGSLSATANEGTGVTFAFSLPLLHYPCRGQLGRDAG
jgi:signal transduction histidine kinase